MGITGAHTFYDFDALFLHCISHFIDVLYGNTRHHFQGSLPISQANFAHSVWFIHDWCCCKSKNTIGATDGVGADSGGDDDGRGRQALLVVVVAMTMVAVC